MQNPTRTQVLFQLWNMLATVASVALIVLVIISAVQTHTQLDWETIIEWSITGVLCVSLTYVSVSLLWMAAEMRARKQLNDEDTNA